MKKIITLCMVLLLSACNGTPIKNIVEAQPSNFNGAPTQEELGKAIALAAINKGWTVHKVKEGHILAELQNRKHFVAVDITYDKTFSIIYKDSENLKYNAKRKTIHKAYNRWIENLRREINRVLSRQSMGLSS